jgi:hypothetical protein
VRLDFAGLVQIDSEELIGYDPRDGDLQVPVTGGARAGGTEPFEARQARERRDRRVDGGEIGEVDPPAGDRGAQARLERLRPAGERELGARPPLVLDRGPELGAGLALVAPGGELEPFGELEVGGGLVAGLDRRGRWPLAAR